MELKDRLKHARRNANKTQKDVAEHVGITQPTLSQLESGLLNSSTFLPAIANYLGVDALWLQTGIKANQTSNVEIFDSNIESGNDEVEIPFFKDFSFACGSGSINEAIVHEKRRLRIPRATLRNLSVTDSNAVAAVATGDSMSPRIEDGDTIYIDLGRKEIKDGRIYVICIGGLHYAKRLYNLPFGGVRLVSDNDAEFEEIRLTVEEIETQQFEIIGWVWSIGKLEKW